MDQANPPAKLEQATKRANKLIEKQVEADAGKLEREIEARHRVAARSRRRHRVAAALVEKQTSTLRRHRSNPACNIETGLL